MSMVYTSNGTIILPSVTNISHWECGFDMEVYLQFENVALIWRFDIIIILRMWV